MQQIQPSATQRIAKRRLRYLWTYGPPALALLAMTIVLLALPGTTFVDRLRWLTSGICAQFPSHSFFPGGIQLPLCARNTGIYLGFVVTLCTLHATRRRRAQRFPPWAIAALLFVGICALAVDGLNSFFLDIGLPHLYQPNNLLRLATGLLTGLALAALILPIINRSLWRNDNDRASVSSWRTYLLLLPGLVVCFFGVASQNSLTLYPVALLSVAGLLIAIGIFNLILLLAVTRRDQQFLRYRELLPLLSIALILAIGELLGLAQLKLALLHALGMRMSM